MPRKKGKLPPVQHEQIVLRSVGFSSGVTDVVIATENPVQRYDEQRGYVVNEVLLMEGIVLRANQSQIPIVDSHDDQTVRNIFGSIRQLQVKDGELHGTPYFASDEESQVIRTRMDEGHITDFSITALPLESLFVPHGQSFTTQRGAVITGPAIIHTRWQPHNASICATGADELSTVRRSYTDLKRKVTRMDEALLGQLAAMGLPEGMTDPNQVLAWVVGKLTPAASAESEGMVESMDATKSEDKVENAVGMAEEKPAEDPAKVENSIKRAVAAFAKADQARRKEIQALCTQHKIERSFADSLCDEGIDLNTARARILERMATKPIGQTTERVAVTESADDKFYAAARDGLVKRAFVGAKLQPFKDGSGAPGHEDFVHMSLSRLAEIVLRQQYQAPVDRMTKNEIAQAAMGNSRVLRKYSIVMRDAYHTTGSFPNLLLDAANKTLLQAYEEAPYTWNLWARQAPSVEDFKNINRMRFSESPDPEMVPEGQDYKEKSLSDAKETYKVDKYGALFTITWETIVNDDLDAISRVPAMHGTACRRKVNKQVYAVLTANATMSDGVALFGSHTSGTNLAGSSAAISVTSLNAGFLAMATQKGLSSDVIVGVTPRYLIVPWAIAATADELITSTTPPTVGGSAVGTSGTNNIYGPNGKRRLEVIAEPQLDLSSATAWYLSADPSQIDTVEVAFLQGEESPVLENEWKMENDTYVYKVRQTFGVKAIDWRGLYKNAGA